VYSDIGCGIPLLCLHGGMGIDRRSLLVRGILDLAGHGIRLIVPDQRGHGESSVGDDSQYTHETWAADVRELARHLGLERFALLGHSYGGFVALEYATRWPDTLTHVVLVATSAGPVHVPARSFGSDHFRDVWPRFFARDDKHRELFDALTFSAAPYNAAFTRELPRYDLRRQVSELTMPALSIVGSEDWYVPDMEWIARNTKRSTLCIIDGAGHFPFIEGADRFVQAVAAFLTGCEAETPLG
jgi:proline iminopeptidase